MKTKSIYYALILLIIYSCGMSSAKGLKQNYDKNNTKITACKEYFNSIIPENYGVRIRYNSSKNIDLFVSKKNKKTDKWESLFGQWNVDYKNYKETPKTEYENDYGGKTKSLDKTLNELNWTQNTIKSIYKKLENINCIGISDGNPTQIEYGFKGLGVLSYLVFDENLSEENQEKYSDDCMYLFYKENIVLSYGSGAIGSFCTPEFERKKTKN